MDERSQAYLDAALERQWITAPQAEEARRIAETVAEVGIDQKIDDILVKKGFLTPERARKISRELSKRKVGKYQIVEKLGEGGAGIVYKANQEPLERVVAIKVLSAERVLSPKYLERFTREARIAVTLNHKNIVRGLDYGEADGYHYFVMEYVKGDSLFSVLGREGTIAEKKAIQMVLQIVAALEHAAKYDLVHRDIKPENILITPDEVVKLCDLGLAKPSLVETAMASRDGTTIGTPTYMSPEQIRGRDETDFRSDVYSLGATLYHMITGRPPFMGESADIVVRKHLRDAVTDPRELNVALSSSIAAIVLKMLAKKPEDRYPSLGSLREDLESVLDGRPPRNTIELGVKRVSGSVRVDVTDPSSRRERIEESRRRSKTPMFMALALVLVAAVVVVVVNPFGKKEAMPDPDLANQPVGPEPSKPTEADLAEKAYRAAVDWCEKNSASDFAARIDKYKAVADRYPESSWGLHARERISEIENRRDEGIRRHREQALQVYDQTLFRAKAMAAAKRFGDALAELASYPAEFKGTEYPERLGRDAERFSKEAEKDYAAAVEKADYEASAGRPDDALKLLEPFLEYGVPAIKTKAEALLADIREERDRQRAARERGKVAYRVAVGEAFLRASRGDWSEARNHLVSAQEKAELSWYGEDLSRIDVQLRSAIRFDAAMQKGADSLVGRVVRLKVIKGSRDEVAGKVLDVSSAGLRMTRTGGSREVPFTDLAAEERTRLAFEVLDNDSVDDHRAAALYLAIHGLFRAGDKEIEAARILGADVVDLEGTRDLYSSFLKGHAEGFVRKALLRINQERWQEALELIDQAVQRTPWFGRPHFFRGQILVKLKRSEDAIAALTLALDLGEKDPEVQYWLGEAWLAENNASNALTAYSKFADLAGNGERLEMVRTRINELRARALAERVASLKADAKKAQRKRNWARVTAIYREVLELDPEDLETMYLLGKACLEKKDILAAYAALKQFTDAGPKGRSANDAKKLIRHLTKTYTETKETKGYLNDADGQYKSGRYQGAVSLCDMALQDSPLSEDAYYRRALAYYRLGQRKEDPEEFAACLEDLKAVEILNETQALVQELRAIVFYYLKDPDEAYRNAEIAMDKLPERWQAYNIAGLVLKEKGRHEKAIEILSLGIRKDPSVAVLYLNRALAWESLQRYERAMADVQTGLEKKPSSNDMKKLVAVRDRVLEAKKKR